jgi:hypothetical protein
MGNRSREVADWMGDHPQAALVRSGVALQQNGMMRDAGRRAGGGEVPDLPQPAMTDDAIEKAVERIYGLTGRLDIRHAEWLRAAEWYESEARHAKREGNESRFELFQSIAIQIRAEAGRRFGKGEG